MAGAGGNMMQGVQNSGSAESGYGVMISGFFAPTVEKQGRLQELLATFKYPEDIEEFESNGHAIVLVSSSDALPMYSQTRVATFRREPHKFFQDLPKFIASTKAQHLKRMVLSGSLGSISLTILYHPHDPKSV